MINKHILKTEEEWLAIRGKYITASEAAILLGHNPFSSPSKIKNDTFKGNANTKLGQLLEPTVVMLTNWSLGTKFKLFETDEGKVFYTNGNLGATPDAYDDISLLECKTTKPERYIDYSQNPPLNYIIQLQVQMHCSEMKEGYLAILGTHFTNLTEMSLENPVWPIVIYKVLYNPEICAIIEQEVERFIKSDKYRVNSAVKRKTGVLLHMTTTKIWN